LNEIGTVPVLSFDICRFLRRIWDIDSKARILCSDLDTVIIFHPPSSPTSSDVVYERSKLQGDLVRLRIIIASYLYVALPKDMFTHCQAARDPFDLKPEGPPIDPCTPMQTDEQAFSTHHRHSDFDFRTLTLDRDRALQFFRWKEHIAKNISPIFVSPGDVVYGVTGGYARSYPVLSSCYPVENVPFETVEHIQSIQRSCPMGHMLKPFLSSETFTLRLLDDITPTAGGGLCRTYKCRIHSIGDEMQGASPLLCLKMFDDRFFPMETPGKELIEAGVQWWWTRYRTAEYHVRNEDAAYKKLEFIQGSLIPYFYGSHSVSCSDPKHIVVLNTSTVRSIGWTPIIWYSDGICPGTVTKHWHCKGPFNGTTRTAGTLSMPVYDILHICQMSHFQVRSTRHAISALQCADVSQHDWHSGQIMCMVIRQNNDDPDAPQPQSVHCVLVDFSATTQSIEEEHHMNDDFGSCLAVLMETDLGLNPEIAWRNFGEREYWDLNMLSAIVGGERRFSVAAEPYEFVYRE
jgi:hypothetical protein